MQASKLPSPLTAISHRCPPLLPSPPRSRKLRVNASRRETNDGKERGDRLVDESMIVLRMRIKELKAMEMSDKDEDGRVGWTEWEKRCFANYDREVYEAVGIVQRYLMSMRPGLALGMAALLAFAVSLSAGLVLVRAVDVANMVVQSLGP